MSARQHSEPYSFQVKFHPSRRVFHMGVAVHVLALIACFLIGLALIFKGLIFMMVLVSLYRQKCSFKPHRWAQLKYSSEQGWAYAQGDGDLTPITILPSTVITTRLVIIHALNENQQWHAIVIGYDSLADDSFRQLRVNLKVLD
ncbi:MAG TPA: hypothetical protein EYN54_07975 [Methylococcaceae bacterium]|jgi:hypothetical protein|nr:hypothetical protein [Methylococcaceae bacterium]HIN67757.1 hypothetical protein [Methylococcales bacterium]HIO13117.1 hypothetical protein [Methylococcales bacterium]